MEKPLLDPTFGKYKVIYADPPWTFVTYSAKGKGRSAEAHYDCMTFQEICDIPVESWAAENAVLLLWVTDPMLPRGLELMEAWGFQYKTVGFYWAKLNKSAIGGSLLVPDDFFTGMGYWTRANPEQCLLGTIGKPQRLDKGVRKLVIYPRREHSRKPDEIHSLIERLVPGPYLEMFARERHPGWEAWGLETHLFEKGPVETRRWPSTKPKPKPGVLTLADLGLDRKETP